MTRTTRPLDPPCDRLETERLVLRALQVSDAPAIRELAGAWEIAETTLLIPHPYPAGLAEDFVQQSRVAREVGSEHVFAIVPREDAAFVGLVSLRVTPLHARGEIGYWIGVPFWGRGYATEAVRRLLGFAFETLGLQRIHASCFARNRASGRVLEKAGMAYEGTRRQHLRRFGRFEDERVYGILREEWRDD